MTRGKRIRAGSGNVFGDLGLPRAQEALAKAELARRIDAIIGARGLTQVQAAAVLGVDQSKVSSLVRGQLSGFSTDRLFRFLLALGQDIDIILRGKPHRRSRAQLTISAVG
jgi:predicted XRE-type DNA-binding protein